MKFFGKLTKQTFVNKVCSISNGLAGQTVIYGLGTIVPRLLNYLLLTPFYTRIFIQQEYGAISELYAFSTLLFVILTHGMETTYFRFSVKGCDEEKRCFNNALFSTGFFALLFFILTIFFNHQIADLIGYKQNSNYIICFAFIIFFDVVTAIPFARLRNQNKALKFALIKLVNVLVNIGLNLFFFVLCKDSDNQSLAALYNENIGIGYAFISNVASSLISFILLLSEYKNFTFKLDFKSYFEMLKYAWPLVIIGLAGMINEAGDKILLKYFISPELDPLHELGIYAANYKLAVLMTIFIQMFKYAAEPYFFRKSLSSDAKESYKLVMTFFVIFCLIIFLAVILFIDLFKYFIGANFWSGLDIVPIVLLANMLLGVYYNLSVWYKINNLTHCGAIISVVGMLVTLFLIAILVPKYGYVGCAWATLACYSTMVVLSYFWGSRVYKVDYEVKKILFYIVFSIIIVLARGIFEIDCKFWSIFVSSLFILLFFIVVLFIEKETIKKLCK